MEVRMLEIELTNPDDFLIIRETLSRIGVVSMARKELIQSCHIFQKRGRYFITHFKELISLDGRCTNIMEEDVERRNDIASILEQWGLCRIVEPKRHKFTGMNRFRILSKDDIINGNWKLKTKYTIGKSIPNPEYSVQ